MTNREAAILQFIKAGVNTSPDLACLFLSTRNRMSVALHDLASKGIIVGGRYAAAAKGRPPIAWRAVG